MPPKRHLGMLGMLLDWLKERKLFEGSSHDVQISYLLSDMEEVTADQCA